ncbi:MAG TPA: wax ester/triacylglycerol synthase family O-acyltransferase [Solimonas sp.]|nr:wax ester/triacylglycerol synthase family O-acyltransferase [Solimonas sp.]
MVRMKPFDAAWFYVESRDAPAHFGPLVILSKPQGSTRSFVRDFVEQWRTCKSFASPFNYRLRKDYIPAWDVLEDRDIDLDYHLRHSALPAPGGERELGILISRLHSHRLDRHRPLWECHVIEGLENDRFAIYLKLHHGQLDGVGAARLIERMCSTDPEKQGLVPPWSVGMRSAPKPSEGRDSPAKVRTPAGLQHRFAGLPKVLNALGDLAQDAYGGRRPETAAPFQAPRTIFNGRIGAQRRFATQTYSLDRFKRIGKAAGVTMNDVFLAASGGALRRYLMEMAALPAKSLVGQLPVNVRPAGDSSVGNHIAFLYAYLHTDIADPVERLRAVSLSTAAGKTRHESLPAEAIEPYTMLLLGPYMTQVILGLGGYVSPAANLVISNVPGPKQRMYFNGARVEQIYGPSVLFHGQALNITMSSYADEVNIGFTGCRDSLPSMQKLAVYTGEELTRLETALGSAGEARASGVRR